MSTSINIGPALKNYVLLINHGVNHLTQQYAAQTEDKRLAAIFHYNVKAGIFNIAASMALVISGATILRGKSPFLGIIGISSMLFTCAAADRSMSIFENSKETAKGFWNQFWGNDSSDKAFAKACAVSATYLTVAKAASKEKNPEWQENMIEIQGYPVLKNWAQA